MKNISQLYWAVIELAKEAGNIQREKFRMKDLKIETKSTVVDMVTEVDIACDHLIVNRLKQLFPDDAILSEEQGVQALHSQNESGYTWIIDPLDGTTNYSIGHPIFAVSIARWYQDTPVFGVVYLPMLDEIYYAEKGKGAYANQNRLHCSSKTKLVESVLATGFPYDRATSENNNSKNIEKMIPLVKGVRRLGAAAYDLCLVAAGIYDAYWELRLSKWDMAAGSLMISEAGGECTYTEENGKYNVVAGAPELCQQIKTICNMTNTREGSAQVPSAHPSTPPSAPPSTPQEHPMDQAIQSDVVIVMGSHRKEGNTAYFTKQLMQALDQRKVRYQYFDVNNLLIKDCLDCTFCKDNLGKCVLDDDMTAFYEAVRTANTVVFASPVYFNGVSSKLKKLIDRCQMIFMCDFAHQKPFVETIDIERKRGYIVSVGGANTYPNQFLGSELSLSLVLNNLRVPLTKHFQFSNTDREPLSNAKNSDLIEKSVQMIVSNDHQQIE